MAAGIFVTVLVVLLLVRRRRRRVRKDASVEGLTELLGNRQERRGRYDQGLYKGRSL